MCPNRQKIQVKALEEFVIFDFLANFCQTGDSTLSEGLKLKKKSGHIALGPTT